MKRFVYYLIIIITLFLVGCANKDNFGPYGSTHSHADFKVYILGKPLNFDSAKYQVMERLTHVENKDGGVLHVHATGITLGFFLKSLGLKLTDECITLDTGNQYCNLGKATLKAYVKSQNTGWVQIYDPADYVINDLDKMLVSYGSESEEDIKKQQLAVTDKSKDT